ncbi:DoxX family protein [Streptomyces sp. NPDC095613]|uniref:DoxX family protein n=1 Tax=Streptomyces sp. NPDC095613 TaxID=3155540 RepID=UPI0033320558
MSVDTRTPRPGFDDQPPLSMLKVDCDPAQVIVNHASFRVKLASPQRPGPARPARGARGADTARVPALRGAGGGARRRAPVVWSGKSEPGDPAASGLLQAVRNSSAGFRAGSQSQAAGAPSRGGSGAALTHEAGATQVIPRIGFDDAESTVPTPIVGSPRSGGSVPPPARPAVPGARTAPLLPPMRQAVGAYDTTYTQGTEVAGRPPYGHGAGGTGAGDDTYPGRGFDRDDEFDRDADRYPETDGDAEADDRPRTQRHGADSVRHAYYPGRRMNLGVVLLPLRVFLGFISVYAGMGKLCDPVYFDGGERGSMVKWLQSLHPWALAEPLRDFALSHPVGAGLSVAFLQIVAGVLTILGLWQRVAAGFGALLSAALLLTVSWRTVPAYDAPDIIYLAAWSPLVIAGAPVYSVDGRLAGEAWRTLGPRSEIWELRRRVLRRGSIVATVVIGLTLLVGSVLGGAVRSSDLVTVPGPDGNPVNQLPGMPLPKKPGRGGGSASGTPDSTRGADAERSEPSATRSGSPTAPQSTPGGGAVPETGGAASTGQTQQQRQPSQTQGTVQQPPQTAEQAPPEPSGQGPSSTGGSGDGGLGGGDGDSGTGSSSGGGGGEARNPIGGLLG